MYKTQQWGWDLSLAFHMLKICNYRTADLDLKQENLSWVVSILNKYIFRVMEAAKSCKDGGPKFVPRFW